MRSKPSEGSEAGQGPGPGPRPRLSTEGAGERGRMGRRGWVVSEDRGCRVGDTCRWTPRIKIVIKIFGFL